MGIHPTPEQFAERVRRAADDEGRLPVPPQAGWEIFPFTPERLQVRSLEPLQLPEPPRGGEGGRPCWSCPVPDRDVVWSSERWVLTGPDEPTGLPFVAMLLPRAHLDLGELDDVHAGELGQLVVRLDRAVRALPAVGRLHVNKWGDGGAHLHVFLLGRPAGLMQLRGSNLALWEEMLPRVPAEEAAAALRQVATELAAWGGQARG
ncbi:MAG: hypothetical protein M3467_12395 [Actinomycetota bacterium]|nr:hypothetical protein [Actinomycetota bacterium]